MFCTMCGEKFKLAFHVLKSNTLGSTLLSYETHFENSIFLFILFLGPDNMNIPLLKMCC